MTKLTLGLKEAYKGNMGRTQYMVAGHANHQIQTMLNKESNTNNTRLEHLGVHVFPESSDE